MFYTEIIYEYDTLKEKQPYRHDRVGSKARKKTNIFIKHFWISKTYSN